MMSKTQKATFAKPSSLPTKLAIALSAVVATQAFAAEYPNHQFGLYYRADLLLNSSDDDTDAKVDKNDELKSKHFSANTIRLNFAGDLTDATSYRVRYRPNRAGDNSDKDKFGSNLDYAYLTHNVNDNFAVRAGKFFWTGRCGREGDYNGQDVYVYSATCNNGGTDYKTGVGFMPMFNGQTLVLSVVNGDESEANHSEFSYGIAYYGDFADGMVKPIAYWSSEASTEQKDATGTKTAEGVNNTEYGIGTRVDFGMAFVEADYLFAEVKDRALVNETDDEYTSLVLAARFMLMNGALQPHLKYIMDEFDDGVSNKASTTSYDRTAYNLALEYYPEMYKEKGVDWRVHLAYTATEKDFDQTAKDKIKDSQVILGFSFNFTNGGPKM
jgi:hypothetical protein